MDGTHCGEEHLIYMERREAILIHAWIIIFILVWLEFFFLLLFSRVAVTFSTWVFLIGNTYLILREGEVI